MSFKELFYLRKSDRDVVIALMVLIVIAMAILVFVGGNNNSTPLNAVVDSTSMYRYGKPYEHRRHDGRQPMYYAVEGRTVELSSFDPNTADSTQLLRLGLSPWQVRNIYHYRAKGGVYRSAEDFSHLYGLTKGQYSKMKPYIHISDEFRPLSVASRLSGTRDSLRYPVKIKPTERVVLNQADTNMLKTVPGIGSGYARAIINYGNRLGGYYDVSQLREILDFPVEAIKYFIIQNPSLRKINVNKSTLNQLRHHPYINYYQAKAITDYHRLHGSLQSMQQLRLMKEFPEEEIRKLEPYLEY
jgi:DNA uptake protein ComE-like DNA-binding protein